MQKVRADVLLVERGLAASREKARALIMAGQVYSGGRRITKPGESVKSDEELSVKGAACPFVGRGGLKLQKAVDVFHIDLAGQGVRGYWRVYRRFYRLYVKVRR